MHMPPGHVAVERYLESEGLPFTVFQPLYIYGPHTAKDCEQWFVDRIIRWGLSSTGALQHNPPPHTHSIPNTHTGPGML